ncbi:MAG: DUF192 domain-containing protein [Solirubrobacterales bacterium]|nr:DUF192 domain-containing protein [Solirubrobacterales bacterium]
MGTFPSTSHLVVVHCAETWFSRLRGLAGHSVHPQPGLALLLPGTRSVHTFGMAFRIDLVWINQRGVIIRIDEAVPPNRTRSCRRADAVVETPIGAARAAGGLEGVRVSLQTHTLGDLLPSKGA